MLSQVSRDTPIISGMKVRRGERGVRLEPLFQGCRVASPSEFHTWFSHCLVKKFMNLWIPFAVAMFWGTFLRVCLGPLYSYFHPWVIHWMFVPDLWKSPGRKKNGVQEVHRARADESIHAKFCCNQAQNWWSLSPTAVLVAIFKNLSVVALLSIFLLIYQQSIQVSVSVFVPPGKTSRRGPGSHRQCIHAKIGLNAATFTLKGSDWMR